MGWFSSVGDWVKRRAEDVVEFVENLDPIQHGSNGDDVLRSYNGLYAKLYGYGGDDVMFAAAAFVRMDGGSGDDRMTSISGDANLYGGSGNDSIFADGIDNYIDGGTGHDYIESLAGKAHILGGSGNDTIQAQGLHNLIEAGAGNDKIYAYAGENNVQGGDGNDWLQVWGIWNEIRGGSGNDTVKAYGVDNDIWTHDGDDLVYAYAASNDIKTMDGDDTVIATAGGNTISLGQGNNNADVKGLSNTIIALDGDDTVKVWGGKNHVALGHGNNRVTALAAFNEILTGNGADTIDADGGYNVIWAGHGHNRADIWGVANDYHGGSGNDTVYAYGADNDIDVASGENYVYVAAASNDINAGIDDDTIIAIGGLNRITTRDGNDYVEADGFGNIIDTGATIDSGLAQFRADRDIVRAFAGGNSISTGRDNDDIFAIGVGNVIDAGEGDDLIVSGGGVATIRAGDGNDTVTSIAGYADIALGAGDDDVRALALYNKVNTGHGDNAVLTGGLVNDVLAGHGDDTITAGGVYNKINTGHGDNQVVAVGAVNDVAMGTGNDTIVAGGAVNIIDDFGGRNTVVAIGAYNSVDLKGADAAGNTVIAGGLVNDITMASGDNTAISIGGVSSITAAGGDDVMIGGGLVNRYDANDGNNLMFALGGLNVFSAGSGDDLMMAAGAVNVLSAGSGNNRLFALGGVNVMTSGNGDDLAVGAGAVNVMDLGEGENTAIAVGGINTVDTGSGNDIAVGVGGVNAFQLGHGDNLSVQLGGYNLVHTGAGDDIAVSLGGLNVQLLGDGDNIAVAAGGVNTITTGSGEDVIVALGGLNVAFAGAGDDILVGAGLANLMDAGAGDDIVVSAGLANVQFGGAGDDIMVGLGKFNIMVGDGSLTAGSPLASFGLKSTASDGQDIMVGGGMYNIMVGGGADDIMVGGGQLNLMVGDALLGGGFDGNDIMVGGGQTNVMMGGGEDDLVIGGGQKNIILGDGLASAAQGMLGSLDMFLDTDSFTNLFGGDLTELLSDSKAVFQEKKRELEDYAAAFEAKLAQMQSEVTQAIQAAEAEIDNFVDGVQDEVDEIADDLQGGLPDGVDFNPGDTFSDPVDGAIDDAQEELDEISDAVKEKVDAAVGDLETKIKDSIALALEAGGELIEALFGDTDTDGNDFIVGGGLDNIMLAGGGDDVMFGGGKNNFMLGGTGSDVMIGGGMDNMMSGDAGDDFMVGGGQTNAMFGGAGSDFMVGGGQDNVMNGGSGDDILLGGGQKNMMQAGAGNDIIVGGGQEILFEGGQGSDLIFGGGQKTNVDGGADDDIIAIGGAENVLAGGDGNDIGLTGGASNRIDGGAGDDLLIAGGQDNVVDGGEGDDALLAAGQNATLTGGSGDDLLVAAGETASLDGGAGQDLLIAAGANTDILGGAGNDIALAAGAGGLIGGGAGNDTIVATGTDYKATGDAGDDLMVGIGAGNVMAGGAGADTMIGAGSDNMLAGGQGDDLLLALASETTLAGGDGADTVKGFGWGILDKIMSGELTDMFQPLIDAVSGKMSGLMESITSAIYSVVAAVTDAVARITQVLSDFDFSRLNPLNYDQETGLSPVADQIGNAGDAVGNADADGAITDAVKAGDNADAAQQEGADANADAQNSLSEAEVQAGEAGQDVSEGISDTTGGETEGSFEGDAADQNAELAQGKAGKDQATGQAQDADELASDIENGVADDLDQAEEAEADAAGKQAQKDSFGSDAADFAGDMAEKASGILNKLSEIGGQLQNLDLSEQLGGDLGVTLDVADLIGLPASDIAEAMDLIEQAQGVLGQVGQLDDILGDIAMDGLKDLLSDIGGDAVNPIYSAIMDAIGSQFGVISDEIVGGAGADTIEGGFGDDTLTGGDGDDHYIYQIGDGQDVIADGGNGTDIIEITTQDVFGLKLGAVDLADLAFEKAGGDLIISLGGGAGGSITLKGMEGAERIETLRLRDGDTFQDYDLSELYAEATDLDHLAWQEQYIAFLEANAAQEPGSVVVMGEAESVALEERLAQLLDLAEAAGEENGSLGDPEKRTRFYELRHVMLADISEGTHQVASAYQIDGTRVVSIQTEELWYKFAQISQLSGTPADKIAKWVTEDVVSVDAIKEALTGDLADTISEELDSPVFDAMSPALVAALGGMIEKHEADLVESAKSGIDSGVDFLGGKSLEVAQETFGISQKRILHFAAVARTIKEAELSNVGDAVKTGAVLSQALSEVDPNGLFADLRLHDLLTKGELAYSSMKSIGALNDDAKLIGQSAMANYQVVQGYNELLGLASGMGVKLPGKPKKVSVPDHIMENGDTLAAIASLKNGIEVYVLYGDHADAVGNGLIGYLTNPSDLVANDPEAGDVAEISMALFDAVKGSAKAGVAGAALEVLDKYVDMAKYTVVTKAAAEAAGLAKYAVSEQEVARVIGLHSPLAFGIEHMFGTLAGALDGTLSLDDMPSELASKIIAHDTNANALEEVMAHQDESLILLERSVENGPVSGGISALESLPADAIVGGDLGGNIVVPGSTVLATRQYFFIKASYANQLRNIIDEKYLGWEIISKEKVADLAKTDFAPIVGSQAEAFADRFTDPEASISTELDLISDNNTFFFILDGGPAGEIAQNALDAVMRDALGSHQDFTLTQAGDFIRDGRQYRMMRIHVLDGQAFGLEGAQTRQDLMIRLQSAYAQVADDLIDGVAALLGDPVTQTTGHLHQYFSQVLSQKAANALTDVPGHGLVGVASKDTVEGILADLISQGLLSENDAAEIALKLLDHQSDAHAEANDAIASAVAANQKVMVVSSEGFAAMALSSGDLVTRLLDPQTGELVYVVRAEAIQARGLDTQGVLDQAVAERVLEDATHGDLDGLTAAIVTSLSEDVQTLENLLSVEVDVPLALIEVDGGSSTAELAEFIDGDLGSFSFGARKFRVVQLAAATGARLDQLSQGFHDALQASGSSLVSAEDAGALFGSISQTAYMNVAQARIAAARLLPGQNPGHDVLLETLATAGTEQLVVIEAAALGDLSNIADSVIRAAFADFDSMPTDVFRRTYTPMGTTYPDGFNPTQAAHLTPGQAMEFTIGGQTYRATYTAAGVTPFFFEKLDITPLLKAQPYAVLDKSVADQLGLLDKALSAEDAAALLGYHLEPEQLASALDGLSHHGDNLEQMEYLADLGLGNHVLKMVDLGLPGEGARGLLADAAGRFEAGNLSFSSGADGLAIGEFRIGGRRIGIWLQYADAALPSVVAGHTRSPSEAAALLEQLMAEVKTDSPLTQEGAGLLFGVGDWEGANEYVADLEQALQMDEMIVVSGELLIVEGLGDMFSIGEENAAAIAEGDHENIRFVSYRNAAGEKVYLINRSYFDAGDIQLAYNESYDKQAFLSDMKALFGNKIDLDAIAARTSLPDMDLHKAISGRGPDGVMIVASSTAAALDASDILTTFSVGGIAYAVVDSVAAALNQAVSNAALDQQAVNDLLKDLNLPNALNDRILVAEEKATVTGAQDLADFYKSLLEIDLAYNAQVYNLGIFNKRVSVGGFFVNSRENEIPADLFGNEAVSLNDVLNEPSKLRNGDGEIYKFFFGSGGPLELTGQEFATGQFDSPFLSDSDSFGASLYDKLHQEDYLSAKLIEVQIKDLHAADYLSDKEMYTLFARLALKQSALAQDVIQAVDQNAAGIALVDYETFSSLGLADREALGLIGVVQDGDGEPVFAYHGSTLLAEGAFDVLANLMDADVTKSIFAHLADTYLKNQVSDAVIQDVTSPALGQAVAFYEVLGTILNGDLDGQSIIALNADETGLVADKVLIGTGAYGAHFYAVDADNPDLANLGDAGPDLGAMLGDLHDFGLLSLQQIHLIGARFASAQNPFLDDLEALIASAPDNGVVLLNGLSSDVPDAEHLGVIRDGETIYHVVRRSYVDGDWAGNGYRMVAHDQALQLLEAAGVAVAENAVLDPSTDLMSLLRDMASLEDRHAFEHDFAPFLVFRADAIPDLGPVAADWKFVEIELDGITWAVAQPTATVLDMSDYEGLAGMIGNTARPSMQELRAMFAAVIPGDVDLNLLLSQTWHDNGLHDFVATAADAAAAGQPLLAVDLVRLLSTPFGDSAELVDSLLRAGGEDWSHGFAGHGLALVDASDFRAVIEQLNAILAPANRIDLHDVLARPDGAVGGGGVSLDALLPHDLKALVPGFQHGDLLDQLEGVSGKFVGITESDLFVPLQNLVASGMFLGSYMDAQGREVLIIRNEAVRRGMTFAPETWSTAGGQSFLQDLAFAGLPTDALGEASEHLDHAGDVFEGNGERVQEFLSDIHASAFNGPVALIDKFIIDSVFGGLSGVPHGLLASNRTLVDPEDSARVYVGVNSDVAAELGMLGFVATQAVVDEIFADHGLVRPPFLAYAAAFGLSDLVDTLVSETIGNGPVAVFDPSAIDAGQITFDGSTITEIGTSGLMTKVVAPGSIDQQYLAAPQAIIQALLATGSPDLTAMQDFAFLLDDAQNYMLNAGPEFALAWAQHTDQEVYFVEGMIDTFDPDLPETTASGVLGYVLGDDGEPVATIVLPDIFANGWHPEQGYSRVIDRAELEASYQLPPALLDLISTEHDDIIPDSDFGALSFSSLSMEVDEAGALLDREVSRTMDAEAESASARDDVYDLSRMLDGVPQDEPESIGA